MIYPEKLHGRSYYKTVQPSLKQPKANIAATNYMKLANLISLIMTVSVVEKFSLRSREARRLGFWLRVKEKLVFYWRNLTDVLRSQSNI